jgi:NADH-quinone oxidoreductase subunit N
VAHAGYMLMGVLSENQYAKGAILYYVLAYSVGSIATFSIVNMLGKATGNNDTESFNGLAKTNPLLAATMTIALLSLAGIPPMSGFFAKFSIFLSAFVAGNEGLVVIAIIASLIGVYYYFKLIIAMYFKTAETETTINIPTQQKILLFVVSILTIALGLFPDFIIKLL